MLLVKIDPAKPISINLPASSKMLLGTYFFVDASITYFTPTQISDYNIIEITDPTLISDLSLLDYSIQDDGSVRKMTTGPNPLSEPLDEQLASFLRGAKFISKRNVGLVYDIKFSAVTYSETALEKSSWDQQLSEAYNVINSGAITAPLLSVLASAKGITLNEMAQRVITASELYTATCNQLVTELKTHTSMIESATTALELKNFGWI